MRTLDTKGAAALLYCSEDRVLELIAKHGLPACNKTGRSWVFVDVDLIEWLRAHYATQGAEDKLPSRRRLATAVQRRYEKALKQPARRMPDASSK